MPVAVVALLLVGRERAAWLTVPAIWPATQWYYSTIAVPALVGRTTASYVAAALLAVPIPGVPVLAVAVVAAEGLASRRSRIAPPAHGSRNAG